MKCDFCGGWVSIHNWWKRRKVHIKMCDDCEEYFLDGEIWVRQQMKKQEELKKDV